MKDCEDDPYKGMTLERMTALMESTLEVIKMLPEEAQESIRDYNKLRSRLIEESDRGCALVAAAYLDDALTNLLQARMVSHKGNTDALLNQGRPVSSFMTKTRVAYAMGLIPDDVFHDINIIRDIRNKFAHLHGPLSFDDRSIADQCGALRLAIESKRRSAPRSRFIHVMTVVYTALSIESRKPRAVAPPADQINELLASTERTLDLARVPTGESATGEQADNGKTP